MNEHRYILEPYKGMNTRYRCPDCNKGKTFSRYIDRETGEHIANHVGRCERLDNCSYHLTPKQYFQDNNISFDTFPKKPHAKPKPDKSDSVKKAVSFIPLEVFKSPARHRLIVITDIGNEPDDFMSMVRLMLYSNQIDIEGLIASTSIHQSKKVSPELIQKVINAYGKVQPNLVKHEPGFQQRKSC